MLCSDSLQSCPPSQAREMEICVYWKDWRAMAAVKFLRLEDFLDNERHGMALHLEPQGILFAEVWHFTNIYPNAYLF